MDLPKQPEAYL